MPIIFNKKIDHATLAIWKIEEDLDYLYKALNSKDKEKCKSYLSGKRKKEFSATRNLLKEIHSGQTIIYNEMGAPILSNDTYLSISHTDNYATIITSETKPCAIDIENLSRIISPKIQSRYLSNQENKLKDTEYFELIAWCAKECAYKILRQENVDFIRDLKIISSEAKEKNIKICTKDNQILDINYFFLENLIICYII